MHFIFYEFMLKKKQIQNAYLNVNCNFCELFIQKHIEN